MMRSDVEMRKHLYTQDLIFQKRNICPEINAQHLEQLPVLSFGVFVALKIPKFLVRT